MNDQILQEISEFCRRRGLAESTFGRRAVNDGKLANRLRNGGRITTDTPARIRTFIARNADAATARRRAAQFPLLRQPAEISAVREYLQREMGNRASRRHGARQYPSASAGGAR